ncbi:MAG TPA: glutamyl-tRNA reductase [Bacillota bacterium]|nr:glutamyl-tRNA reductase [Bacillota bacterium]
MHILKVGFNYKTAPIEIREQLAFSEETLGEAMLQLKEQKSVLENVIISTCNRTDIYAVVDQLHTGRYYIKHFLEEWFGVKKENFVSYLDIVENEQAIRHLMKLVTGLDSMVLGETQILGQVRDAFFLAQENKTSGTIFNELFKQAITFAKRAHNETEIGENAVSVSYAAVQLAKKIFGSLHDKHVVIYGAGEMGELAAINLHGSGVEEMTVVNRTFTRAQKLADRFQAKAEKMSNLHNVLEQADILITSTASEDVVLTKEDIMPIQKQRKGKPLFLVDIAVPRDLDPAIGELDDVFLYDIDDLEHIVDENLSERQKAAEKIDQMIQTEIDTFNEWVQTLGVVPVISALRKKALSIQATTMKSIERKIPDLTEREKKVLNKHTKSIINQLLKNPIMQAKEIAGMEDREQALAQFIDIFGIDDEVQEEFVKQANKDKTLKQLNTSKRVSFPMDVIPQ